MSPIKRLEHLQSFLMSEKINFLILDDPINLLYLTGLHLEKARLIVGQTIGRLFVDGRFLEEAHKKSPCAVFLAEEESLFDFFMIYAKGENIKIAFDSSSLSYSGYQKLADFFASLSKQAGRNLFFEMVPIDNPLRDIRSIKSHGEISAIRRASNITWAGFEHVCAHLKEGVSEKTLALEFEIFCRQNGAEALAFEPLICFGPNSAMPHHRSDETRLKMDDIVLIDVGAKVDGYCSDMTRVVFFGKADPMLEQCYDIVKKAQNRALILCKPGEHIGAIDKAARDYIESQGFGKDFLHSTGHGVGIEVHEYPSVKFNGKDKDHPIRPGMVITVEPGIYKPGIGGVRYEDTIVITKDGYDNFF
jgi:Xaa-Pro aminopeptidase